MLKKRLREMVAKYKNNNRDSLFRSGASEEFKARTWELLREYVDRSQAANEVSQQGRTQRLQVEQLKTSKKANAATQAMSVKFGNAAPPPISPTNATEATPTTPTSAGLGASRAGRDSSGVLSPAAPHAQAPEELTLLSPERQLRLLSPGRQLARPASAPPSPDEGSAAKRRNPAQGAAGPRQKKPSGDALSQFLDAHNSGSAQRMADLTELRRLDIQARLDEARIDRETRLEESRERRAQGQSQIDLQQQELAIRQQLAAKEAEVRLREAAERLEIERFRAEADRARVDAQTQQITASNAMLTTMVRDMMAQQQQMFLSLLEDKKKSQ